MVSVQSPLFRVSSKLSQADHYLFVYRRFGCLPPIHASFWDLPVFGHWLDQFILIWLLLWSTRERLFTSIRIFTLSSCDHDMGWVRFLLWHGDPDASHQPFDFIYYRHLPNLSLRLQRRFLSPQRLPKVCLQSQPLKAFTSSRTHHWTFPFRSGLDSVIELTYLLPVLIGGQRIIVEGY